MPVKGLMITKVCDNPACAKPFDVWPSRAERTRFCSVACIKAMRIDKICELCGASFIVTASRANQRYCSKKCSNSVNSIAATAAQQATDAVTPLIPAMIDLHSQGKPAHEIAAELGVTMAVVHYRLRVLGLRCRRGNHKPWKDETRQKIKDTQRNVGAKNPHYLPLPEKDLRTLYESGMSAARVGNALGCSESVVLTRIRQLGIPVRKAGYSGYRPARDGHIVQSSLEEAVDNWLFDHGIQHEIQPPCPWSKNGQTGRADFRVGPIYIEVWGVTGSPAYRARQQYKLTQYHECGANLIQIYPHHILHDDYSPLEPLLVPPPTL